MDAYSLDLRRRIVNAYSHGEGSQAVLAKRFSVSEQWVQRLLRTFRITGSYESKPHGGGQRRKIDAAQEILLLKAVNETPDASLEELRDACNIRGSLTCVARCLERLKIVRKKRRFCAWSKPTRR